jgi:hypothetical protein
MVMNSVYDSLRALLRHKELEIKRLEKEIEALRIVLPIVQEAGPAALEEAAAAEKTGSENGKGRPFVASPDLNSVIAQVKSQASSSSPAPATEINSKNRTSWP